MIVPSFLSPIIIQLKVNTRLKGYQPSYCKRCQPFIEKMGKAAFFSSLKGKRKLSIGPYIRVNKSQRCVYARSFQLVFFVLPYGGKKQISNLKLISRFIINLQYPHHDKYLLSTWNSSKENTINVKIQPLFVSSHYQEKPITGM